MPPSRSISERLQPLSHALLVQSDLRAIRLIATDMDGTLTQQGKFSPLLLQALQELAQAGFAIIITTGRSAGWVSGLACYLPIVGAMAENGGVWFANYDAGGKALKNGAVPELLGLSTDLAEHRQQLAAVFRSLQAEFPQIQESLDNRFRLTDWTFDVFGLTIAQLQTLQARCLSQGWGFTYSTVQCHIRPLRQDKASGLQTLLQRSFPDCLPDRLLTVGDSPNDESLFDADRFPLSVGVANVLHYRDQMQHLPRYVTRSPEVTGFTEIAEILLKVASTPD